MRYCGSLSSQVYLNLPCGSRWEVGLTKTDGTVWIEQGWNEFAQHCSLSRGNLLVFRYEGDSQFTVIIFDNTTVEIDCSSSHNHFGKHVETGEDDVGIPKTRHKSPLPCSRPQKKRKTDHKSKGIDRKSVV